MEAGTEGDGSIAHSPPDFAARQRMETEPFGISVRHMEWNTRQVSTSTLVLCCVVLCQARERERERRGRNFCTHSQSHRPMFDKRPRRATGVSLFGSWRNSCAVMLALPMQMAAPVSSYTSIDTVASTFSALVVCVCVCVCVFL